MKTKAFSYVRFSTPEQAKGSSLERQLQAARDYATSQNLDLDETLTFQDHGISAFKGQNFHEGQLAAFVTACEAGRVPQGSYLLVENLDRLSRQRPVEALAQLQEILRRGVTVVTLQDRRTYPPDALNDTTNLLMSIFMMARAHEESSVKAARLGKAWELKRRRAVEEGKPMTAMSPGWLILKDGQYALVEDRAAIVAKIFQLSLEGNGKSHIAKALNTQGVPPFGRGKGWHPSSVQKILESEATLGTYQPHRVTKAQNGSRSRTPEGDPIRGFFPPVIDEATFLRARAVREERRIPTGRKGIRLSNLFTGLAKCAICGGPMHFDNKGEGYTRIGCGNLKRGIVNHPSNAWRYSIAERFTVLALLEHLDFAQMFPAGQGDRQREALSVIEGDLIALRERITRHDKMIETLIALVLDEPKSVALRERLRKAEGEKVAEQDRLAVLEAACAIARANLIEGEQDRESARDALKRWAALSEGEDATEAYRVRLALQQLFKRTVMHIEFHRAEDTWRYGFISVTSKSGARVQLSLDDQNDDGEMRAGVAHFSPNETTAKADWTKWENVEVPEWWPT